MCELTPEAAFADVLGALPSDLRAGPVGLAVSGGSDSLALLHLAAGWARQAGAELTVFTVDHGLRPEAAGEAAAVAEVSAGLGLPHRTLRWAAPRAGQAAARDARHRLLAAALRSAGGRLLLTGHTADDQAETMLLRMRQGSGWYGLAGMRRLSLSPVWPEGEGVWIARPLIGLGREALREGLRARGAGWSEDPSNLNPAFERVRMRRLLADRPGLTERVMACQRGFARLRAAEDALLACWLADVQVGAGPVLSVRIAGCAPGRLARGLSVLIPLIAGHDRPPRSQAGERLALRLVDPVAAFRGATLGGARLRPAGQGRVRIRPETRPDEAEFMQNAVKARLSALTRLYALGAAGA